MTPNRTGPARGGAAVWVLAALGLVLLVALALASAMHHDLVHLGLPPISIVVDGEEVVDDLDLAALSADAQLALFAGLVLAMIVVVVVVPLTLLGVVAMLTFVMIGVFGVPLALVAVVLAVALSPLLLLVLLLRRLLRGPRRPGPATIGP